MTVLLGSLFFMFMLHVGNALFFVLYQTIHHEKLHENKKGTVIHFIAFKLYFHFTDNVELNILLKQQ